MSGAWLLGVLHYILIPSHFYDILIQSDLDADLYASV